MVLNNINDLKLTNPQDLFGSLKSNVKSNDVPSVTKISFSKSDSFNATPLFEKSPSKNSKPISLGLDKNNTTSLPVKSPKSFSISDLLYGNVESKPVELFNRTVSSGVSVDKLEGIPSRSTNAVTGSQFIANTKHLDRFQREDAILAEVMNGNVPDFARNMKEVYIFGKGKDGVVHTAKINVMPDYLAIGSNEDFVRIPMNPLTAQKIADQTGTMLPTQKIVDEVYKQAEVKMTPQPMKPGAQMMSNDYYITHNNKVEAQRIEKGSKLGQLISGHKKDVVITNRLQQRPKQVAIYGWHQKNGKAIQPLSTIHENTYADYSHGVRLVSGKMTIDGQEKNISDVLKDPNLASILSYEGVMPNPRVPS